MPVTEDKPDSGGGGVSVKVAIRVRPLLERENVKRCKECLYVLPNRHQIVLGRDQNFTFDYVFSNNSSQADVYNESVSPLMDACFEGYNATVFAYGQTGAGKTFTIDGDQSNESAGVIPRAVTHLFDHIKEQSNESTTYQVKVSYLEIYLEEVKDLLRPNTEEDIHIREDDKGNTVVQGVSEIEVTSTKELLMLMKMGTSTRTTGATLMNQHSSRSHAIMTLYINKRAPASVRNIEITSAKFHFVDLAGSERAHRTGNVGERFKESVHINSGLLALGNVISALSDNKRKSSHIPYRDSKITRLLKDSLGGNSRTLMITCVSPANDSFEETLNSLKYAKRARNIKNCPIVNKDYEELEMKRMESEIIQLREQLKTREKSSSTISSSDNAQVESLIEEKSLLESELENYKHLLNICQSDIEKSLQTKSLSLLVPLIEKLKFRESREFTDTRSSSHISVFGADDEIEKLRDELNQYKADLANDEEIFAEQLRDMDELKGVLNGKIVRYEDEIKGLRVEVNRLKRITTQSIDLAERTVRSNPQPSTTTLKYPLNKPSTMSEIQELIKQRTFIILERNLKNCLKSSPKTSLSLSKDVDVCHVTRIEPCDWSKDESTCPKAKAPCSSMMKTYVIPECSEPSHCGLKKELEQMLEQNKLLSEEVNNKKNVGESKKILEKNVNNLKKQKSELEKKLQAAETEVVKLQSKIKKDKLVSLGREKINPARATSQHITPSKIEWLEAEIESVLKQRGFLKDQEEELKRREDAITERELLQKEVNKLKNKDVRASQVMSNDLLRMSMKLESLTTGIQEKEHILNKTQTLSKTVNLEKDLRKMSDKRDKLKKTITQLTEKMVGTILTDTENEELRELQEAIEIITIAINYRTSLIDTSMSTLCTDDITHLIPQLDEATSRKVIQALFDKLIETKEDVLRIEEGNKLLNIQLEGERHEMKALQSTFTEANKVALIAKTSENKCQLEKDVEYYKKLAKDLKQKLRHQQGGGGGVCGGGGDNVTSSIPGVLTPVRKSKKELRPITAEEAFHRSSTTFS